MGHILYIQLTADGIVCIQEIKYEKHNKEKWAAFAAHFVYLLYYNVTVYVMLPAISMVSASPTSSTLQGLAVSTVILTVLPSRTTLMCAASDLSML